MGLTDRGSRCNVLKQARARTLRASKYAGGKHGAVRQNVVGLCHDVSLRTFQV